MKLDSDSREELRLRGGWEVRATTRGDLDTPAADDVPNGLCPIAPESKSVLYSPSNTSATYHQFGATWFICPIPTVQCQKPERQELNRDGTRTLILNLKRENSIYKARVSHEYPHNGKSLYQRAVSTGRRSWVIGS